MPAAKPASRCLRSCGNIPERCSSFLRRRKKQTILFQDGQENQKVGVGKDKFLLTIYLNFVVRVTLHLFHTFLKSLGKLRKFTRKIERCEKQQPNNSMRSDTKIPNVLPGSDPDVPGSNICSSVDVKHMALRSKPSTNKLYIVLDFKSSRWRGVRQKRFHPVARLGSFGPTGQQPN